MEKKATGQKVKAFLKRNVYYIIMLVSILAIGAMVTVAVLATRNNPDDPAGPTVNKPEDPDTPDDNQPSGNQPVNPPADDQPTPPKPEKVVFSAPVNGGTLVKDYSMDLIVYSSTLRQYMVHDGIDFGGEAGAQVCAVYGGEVEAVTYDSLKGHRVVINHGDGLKTTYYSLGDTPTVKVGQTVKQGDTIGVIGTSASSEMVDGAHVHFNVTLNGKTVSPYNYLPDSSEK